MYKFVRYNAKSDTVRVLEFVPTFRSNKHSHPLLGLGKKCYRCDVNRVVSEKEISIPAKDFRPAVILQNCQFQLIRKKKKLHFVLQLNAGRGLELYFIMRRCRRENVFSRGKKAIHKKQEKPKEPFNEFAILY